MGILTAVLALAGEHVGVLAFGGTVGGALEMALPRDQAFARADLAGNREDEVHAVEK